MHTRVIALSRQVGTNGEEVGLALSERLGFRYIDYQIVQEAAQEANVSPETVSDAQHTPSLMTRILEALARSPSIPSGGWSDPGTLQTSPMVTSADYRRFIEGVIYDVADRGEAIILGHGGAILLADRADTLRVLITGTKKHRARTLMKTMDVGEQQALKLVERSDAERTDYFRRFYDRSWLSPATYDLCLNSDNLTVDNMAEIIVQTAHVL